MCANGEKESADIRHGMPCSEQILCALIRIGGIINPQRNVTRVCDSVVCSGPPVAACYAMGICLGANNKSDSKPRTQVSNGTSKLKEDTYKVVRSRHLFVMQYLDFFFFP
jgi:hypothetical protein